MAIEAVVVHPLVAAAPRECCEDRPVTARTAITRAELLKYNPRCSDHDRAIIEEDLDEFGGVVFERVERSGWNQYVAVSDAEGNGLMHVAKGTIYYVPPRTRTGSGPRSPDEEGHVYRLSTHSASGGTTKSDPVAAPLCSTCWLQHPDGECDR